LIDDEPNFAKISTAKRGKQVVDTSSAVSKKLKAVPRD